MQCIINRERELTELCRLAAHPPGLAVLRGQRRVGKTFLLRTALTGERVIALQAEEKPLPLQLEAFARECARLLPGSPPLTFTNWSDAFNFTENQATAYGPLTIVLDEFQYLAATATGLASTIQHFWHKWDAEKIPILLVLTSSAFSVMDRLLSGPGPTFERGNFHSLLLPLNYRESAKFASTESSPIELIERFAILGGTPQYQAWVGKRNLFQAIKEICLQPDAPLYSDPENLIREEDSIREAGPYFGILETIASGTNTTSAIARRLQLSQQSVAKLLTRLTELGYLLRTEPIQPDRKVSSRGYWKICNPYFRFWFRYVFPNRGRLSRGRSHEVVDEIRRDLSMIVAPVFEECCRQWIGKYSPLGADAVEIGSWWSRRSDSEIGIVTTTKNKYEVLGECKWSSRQVGENILDDLYVARTGLGRAAANAQLVLFSRSGFTSAVINRAAAEGITLVTPDELFS